jgi:hypothetical protein
MAWLGASIATKQIAMMMLVHAPIAYFFLLVVAFRMVVSDLDTGNSEKIRYHIA